MPWCPNCGMEYREGFAQCADCQVDLVESRLDAEAASKEAKRERARLRREQGSAGWRGRWEGLGLPLALIGLVLALGLLDSALADVILYQPAFAHVGGLILAGLAICFMRGKGEPFPRVRHNVAKALAMGLVLAVFVQIVAYAGMLDRGGGVRLLFQPLEAFREGDARYIAVALLSLVTAVTGAVLYELLFRGVLLTRLLRTRTFWRANFIQAAILGLTAVLLQQVPYVPMYIQMGEINIYALTGSFEILVRTFVSGLMAGWLYGITNTLLTPMVMNATTGLIGACITIESKGWMFLEYKSSMAGSTLGLGLAWAIMLFWWAMTKEGGLRNVPCELTNWQDT
ncbi:CPBP family intramembrane metalloprotease [Ruminococcaceae bacterium OttesenSCG-928-L11]|nr:CPBP family intramembrane metalloprotease [Ruminococcaceae bacterium OttesenSCG-928-L11]